MIFILTLVKSYSRNSWLRHFFAFSCCPNRLCLHELLSAEVSGAAVQDKRHASLLSKISSCHASIFDLNNKSFPFDISAACLLDLARILQGTCQDQDNDIFRVALDLLNLSIYATAQISVPIHVLNNLVRILEHH